MTFAAVSDPLIHCIFSIAYPQLCSRTNTLVPVISIIPVASPTSVWLNWPSWHISTLLTHCMYWLNAIHAANQFDLVTDRWSRPVYPRFNYTLNLLDMWTLRSAVQSKQTIYYLKFREMFYSLLHHLRIQNKGKDITQNKQINTRFISWRVSIEWVMICTFECGIKSLLLCTMLCFPNKEERHFPETSPRVNCWFWQ